MYIRLSNNGYPLTERQVREENPNVTGPMPYPGYETVFPAPQPTFDRITQGVREIAPELTVKGTWEQRWEVYALDADVIAANQAAEAQRVQAEVVSNTQKRLDDFARTRNYDGILSACTYATSSVAKFATEGQYCVSARDATWAKLYEMLDEVQAGTRPVPSGYPDIEPELPPLAWPNP